MKTLPECSTNFIVILLVFGCLTSFGFDRAKSKTNDFQEAEVYMTAESTNDLLTNYGFRAFEPLNQPDENYPTIMIDLDKTFQTIEGFGGAFTDASAVNFAKLSKEKQQEFIKSCFDPDEGNGYTLCRTTIHSCDYSDEMYTYDDVEGDKELKHFSIDHDRKYRLPLIKQALAAAGGKMKIYASPWSPPPWMKTNGEMKHGGKLKPEYFQTWADYFVKYVKAYEQEGIPMWGLTVQNEPMAVQVWESCIFTAEEERDFVRDYLGPALEKNGLSDMKLMIWDHNRGIMYQRAEVVYDDPKASRYVWGLAFHYYVGDHFDNVRIVHDAFPDKKLIYTEAGMGGDWRTGVRVAKNMVLDLNNWANGWTYWNILLDENRGPRHAGGLGGSSIVTVNTKTDELFFNPPFYYFGHFSRFIKPGAKRIACTSNSDDFLATAFVNTNETVAVVILNLSDADRIFQLWVNGRALKGSAPPKAIFTMTF
ncbi:glycoside hydrolase family 30 protein [candidate division KSB1 bacterium]|nr:glycoside hydrolase family 30 protein [candidate division KSB1 bacterium]